MRSISDVLRISIAIAHECAARAWSVQYRFDLESRPATPPGPGRPLRSDDATGTLWR
jgi:hypothetical protein